jgi:hypothetical protein
MKLEAGFQCLVFGLVARPQADIPAQLLFKF